MGVRRERRVYFVGRSVGRTGGPERSGEPQRHSGIERTSGGKKGRVRVLRVGSGGCLGS